MILLVLVAAIILYFVARQYQEVKRLPPGPLAFPLIGTLPQLAYYIWKAKGVAPAFELLRKKYGNVYTLWIGPYPHVHILDYETSHEVFIKNGSKYKERSVPEIIEFMRGGHGLFLANGDNCAELRKFTMMTLRNMGVGKNEMEQKILEELNLKCTALNSQAGRDGRIIVQTNEFFDYLVASIINMILVGERIDEHNKHELVTADELTHDAFSCLGIPDFIFPVAWLKRIVPSRLKNLKKKVNEAADFIALEATRRLAAIKAGEYVLDENPVDFVNAFLEKMLKENENGGHPAYNMTALKFLLADLWLAGKSTTTDTLVTGFNLLVHHLDIQEKVRVELQLVTENGTRDLSLMDKSKTPFLTATIAEVQRIASLDNYIFARPVHEPGTVGRYQLKVGDSVSTQSGGLHLNEEIFPNAEKFDPERFMKNDTLLQHLIPYGIGKRNCIGESLARAELYLIFGNLILRYNFRAHEKLPELFDQTPYSFGRSPDKTAKLEFIEI